MTVTATQGGMTANGLLLRVKVLTGASAGQPGATGIFASGGTSACEASLTTTVTGSAVYGAAMKGVQSSFSADAAAVLIDNVPDTIQGNQYGTFGPAALTGTPGALTIGFSSPSSADETNVAAAEILPAGTIAEDPTGPAPVSSLTATSVMTASFSPPGGSVLVALVSSD